MRRPRPLSRTPPRSSAPLSHRGPASMCPSWFPSSSPPRSVWTCPRRCALGPGPTPGRSRSPLSRSGVMCPQRNLVLLNKFICHQPESFEFEIAFEQKEILVRKSSYGTKINLPVALLSTHIVSFCNYLKL